MDFLIIRNKRQLLNLKELLDERRLPFKIALQNIYPTRTVEFNDYLWGFIYTPIAEFTGHTPEEIHEICKKRYNFRYDFKFNDKTKKYEFAVGVGSTTTLDQKEIWDYAARIRADAEIELHLTLHLPNEAFIPELDFEHDKIEKKRL